MESRLGCRPLLLLLMVLSSNWGQSLTSEAITVTEKHRSGVSCLECKRKTFIYYNQESRESNVHSMLHSANSNSTVFKSTCRILTPATSHMKRRPINFQRKEIGNDFDNLRSFLTPIYFAFRNISMSLPIVDLSFPTYDKIWSFFSSDSYRSIDNVSCVGCSKVINITIKEEVSHDRKCTSFFFVSNGFKHIALSKSIPQCPRLLNYEIDTGYGHKTTINKGYKKATARSTTSKIQGQHSNETVGMKIDFNRRTLYRDNTTIKAHSQYFAFWKRTLTVERSLQEHSLPFLSWLFEVLNRNRGCSVKEGMCWLNNKKLYTVEYKKETGNVASIQREIIGYYYWSNIPKHLNMEQERCIPYFIWLFETLSKCKGCCKEGGACWLVNENKYTCKKARANSSSDVSILVSEDERNKLEKNLKYHEVNRFIPSLCKAEPYCCWSDYPSRSTMKKKICLQYYYWLFETLNIQRGCRNAGGAFWFTHKNRSDDGMMRSTSIAEQVPLIGGEMETAYGRFGNKETNDLCSNQNWSDSPMDTKLQQKTCMHYFSWLFEKFNKNKGCCKNGSLCDLVCHIGNKWRMYTDNEGVSVESGKINALEDLVEDKKTSSLVVNHYEGKTYNYWSVSVVQKVKQMESCMLFYFWLFETLNKNRGCCTKGGTCWYPHMKRLSTGNNQNATAVESTSVKDGKMGTLVKGFNDNIRNGFFGTHCEVKSNVCWMDLPSDFFPKQISCLHIYHWLYETLNRNRGCCLYGGSCWFGLEKKFTEKDEHDSTNVSYIPILKDKTKPLWKSIDGNDLSTILTIPFKVKSYSWTDTLNHQDSEQKRCLRFYTWLFETLNRRRGCCKKGEVCWLVYQGRYDRGTDQEIKVVEGGIFLEGENELTARHVEERERENPLIIPCVLQPHFCWSNSLIHIKFQQRNSLQHYVWLFETLNRRRGCCKQGNICWLGGYGDGIDQDTVGAEPGSLLGDESELDNRNFKEIGLEVTTEIHCKMGSHNCWSNSPLRKTFQQSNSLHYYFWLFETMRRGRGCCRQGDKCLTHTKPNFAEKEREENLFFYTSKIKSKLEEKKVDYTRLTTADKAMDDNLSDFTSESQSLSSLEINEKDHAPLLRSTFLDGKIKHPVMESTSFGAITDGIVFNITTSVSDEKALSMRENRSSYATNTSSTSSHHINTKLAQLKSSNVQSVAKTVIPTSSYITPQKDLKRDYVMMYDRRTDVKRDFPSACKFHHKASVKNEEIKKKDDLCKRRICFFPTSSTCQWIFYKWPLFISLKEDLSPADVADADVIFLLVGLIFLAYIRHILRHLFQAGGVRTPVKAKDDSILNKSLENLPVKEIVYDEKPKRDLNTEHLSNDTDPRTLKIREVETITAILNIPVSDSSDYLGNIHFPRNEYRDIRF